MSESKYITETSPTFHPTNNVRVVPVGGLRGRARFGPYQPEGEAEDECGRLNEAYELGTWDGGVPNKNVADLLAACEDLMNSVEVRDDEYQEQAIYITSHDRWPDRHVKVRALRAVLNKFKP